MRRLLTAGVLVPAILLLIRAAPPFAFTVVFSIAIALAVFEVYRMLETLGYRPFKLLGVAGTFALVWAAGTTEPRIDPLLAMSTVVFLAMSASLWTRRGPRPMFDASWSTVFPLVVFGWMLAYLVRLRAVGGEVGEDLLVLLLVCVAFADTAAFYVGSALGKHQLAPNLSPKKSVEGAVAALFGAVGGGLLAHVWFYRALPLGHAITLGAILGTLGILGDLAESMIKRATGAKDSSGLLPGHGGLLDRFDSLVFASPFLFYYYLYVLEPGS